MPTASTAFAAVFDAALLEHLEAVTERLAAGAKPRAKSEAEISIRDNGMPSLSDGGWNSRGPPDYAALFDPSYGDDAARARGRYPEDAFPKLHALTTWVMENQGVAPGLHHELSHDFAKIDLQLRIGDAAAAHLDRYGAGGGTPASRRATMAPILRAIFEQRLLCALVVPIALTHFDFDRVSIGPRVLILRMSEALQKARWSSKAYASKGHDSILSAATHAFVLTGWQVENEGLYGAARALSNRWPQAREDIDLLFAALRLATGVDTGYAQEVRLARGWRRYTRPDRPEVYAVGARRYPEWMDEWGWDAGQLPRVSRAQALETGRLFKRIKLRSEPRMALALRRLNTATTREDPADAVLDATIALEILLGDGDSQAISWKLRMRAAALAGLHSDHAAMEAVRASLTKIYELRSAIVHGSSSKKAKATKSMLSPQEGRLAAVAALRSVLLTLLDHPEFLDPIRIDRELMMVARLPAAPPPT